MAAMTDAEKAKAARIFARQVYNGSTCDVTHADLIAAVSAIDNAMEGVPTLMPNQLQSVANNLNIALPDPFKTVATASQKATMLAIWAGVKYGYIISGGD